MSKPQKFLTVLAVVVVAVILAAAGGAAWVLFGGRPAYSGAVQLGGLSAKVNIYRDEHGVPHIFAKNMNDAARALGYVHASERLFQMEMQRRAGQGRLSEVVGPSMLPIDKFIRTLGIYHLSETSFDAMSPDAHDFLNAYCDGVNAWLATHHHSLPPEFTLLGFKPEPWRPADSVVWGKLMALQLSHNYKLEELRAFLAKKISPSMMKGLFPPYATDSPLTLQKQAAASSPPLSLAEDTGPDLLGQVTGLDHAASNEWVISGDRTDTGKPILANDPHLSLGIPILWYLARIVTPDLAIKGATVPGLPVVLLGQNNSIAWGMTTTGSDVQDLFIETLDPKNPKNYLTPGGSKAFDMHTEVIHTKGLDDVTLQVRTTRHGPVLSDIDADLATLAGPGKVVALAFTGLNGDDRTAEALMQLNRVASWGDFRSALKIYQAPPQNIVFADAKGDIGFINPGLLPIRKKGDGLMPVDGKSGTYDWTGMVPFDQLPQMYNPDRGYIFNANNALAGADNKPYLGVDWEEPFRAERLQEFFDRPGKQTLEISIAMQADHVSNAARQLLPYLLKQKPGSHDAQTALEMLRNWDGAMDRTQPEPLIFDAWLYQMHKLLFVDKVGVNLDERGPYAATAIIYALSHQGSGWCGAKACDALIMRALDDALAMLQSRDGGDMNKWRWGSEHALFLKNKVFTHVPFLRDYSDLTLPSSGDFYTLDRGGSFDFDSGHPFQRQHGGGYRGIYDLSDPSKSRFMITTGESGHIFSPHYRDLAPLWNNVESVTLSGSEKDLAAQNLPLLTLTP